VYFIESTLKIGGWKELEAACAGAASGRARRFTSLARYGASGGVHVRGNCVRLAEECAWRGGYVGFADAATAPTCECLGNNEEEGAVWTGVLNCSAVCSDVVLELIIAFLKNSMLAILCP
jgi:hypothetical protein